MTGFGLACRYGLVSGVCLVLHNAIVIAGDGLHHGLPVVMAESVLVVATAGYLLHSRYTFAQEPSWPAFLRYGVAMAMNLPASIVVLWLFARLLAWPMVLAAPAATATMIAVNFVASRWAIHRDRASATERHAC